MVKPFLILVGLPLKPVSAVAKLLHFQLNKHKAVGAGLFDELESVP
jgi:hypothetical protein